MSKPNFTPGPLAIRRMANHWQVATDAGSPVADVHGNFHPTAEADARLIAAAPALYEALEAVEAELIGIMLEETCDHAVGICWCATFRAMEHARAALAAARGEG